jgi:hypothetical protein
LASAAPEQTKNAEEVKEEEAQEISDSKAVGSRPFFPFSPFSVLFAEQ